jgi:hypothetical protein
VAYDGAVGVSVLVQFLDQGVCLTRWDCGQQSAACLRIEQKAGVRIVGNV